LQDLFSIERKTVSDLVGCCMGENREAFEVRYDLPVVFVPTVQAGARLVERWAFYFARQSVETVNNLLRENQ
jgi:hypothetical protein